MRSAVIQRVLLISFALCCCLLAETSPKVGDLRTYSLPSDTISADISPNEKHVVALVRHLEPTDSRSKMKSTDSLEVWDFLQSKLTAEKPLGEELRDESQIWNRRGFVRYSADDQIIVCYLEHDLYVLRQSDLQEIRRIRLKGPPDETRSFTTKTGPHTVVDRGEVTALELSGDGKAAAVVWVRGLLDAWVDLVQLDSGQEAVWNTKDRQVGYMQPTSIAWSGDGQWLILAVPNNWPCGDPDDQPDVFAVEPKTGAIRYKLTTGLLVGEIAVTPDARVLAVDRNCVGVWKNHDPKLRIFDLYTGKRIKELSGRGGGVRYEVSASRFGNRAVADTGIVKEKFDWGDMLPVDSHVDSTFSVWDLTNYDHVITSQNLLQRLQGGSKHQVRLPLRMSPNGGFVLKGSNIYELP